MEEKNANNSENNRDNKKNAKQIIKKQRWKTINTYSEREAKEKLFAALSALDERDAIIELKDKAIDRLKPKDENKDMYLGYKSEAFDMDKIVFVLRRYAKVRTTQELKDELIKCEPILVQAWKDPFKSVSEIVYRAVKIGCLIRYNKAGVHGFTYALPEWFDENGILNKKFAR